MIRRVMIPSLRRFRRVVPGLLCAASALSQAAGSGPDGWQDALGQPVSGMSAWYSPDERTHLVLQHAQPWPEDPVDTWVSRIADEEIERQSAKRQLENAFPIDWRHTADGLRIGTLLMHTRRNEVRFTEELLFLVDPGKQIQRAHLMSPRSHEGHATARAAVLEHMQQQMHGSASDTRSAAKGVRSPDAIVLAARREAPLPVVPQGWQLETELHVDEPALDGFVRYATPDRELLVYLAPGQPPTSQTPGEWLTQFNRQRNFDKNGTLAVTLSPASVEQRDDALLARQTVLVEVEQNWPYQIETIAVMRDQQPTQWAALVQAGEQSPNPDSLAQAEALVLAARRPTAD